MITQSQNLQVVLYARYSPRSKRCPSIQAQLADMREYCKQQGWKIVGEYSDELRTGKRFNTGLKAALAGCKAGQGFMVRNLDRMARELRLAVSIEETVRRRRLVLISQEQGGIQGDSDEEWLTRHLHYIMAEYDRRIIGKRTARVMRRHQADGRAMSKIPPFGYRRNGKALVADETEQAVIARMQELRAGGGSYAQIGRQLRHERLLCRGNIWHPKTVERILKRVGTTV